MNKTEGLYYTVLNEQVVQCNLCPHNCLLKPGQQGICKVRYNQGGKLYTEVYSEVTSLTIDPIEKKPLYHFYPGSDILSVGTTGCNMSCTFCQNHTISQKESPTYYHRKVTPYELADLASRHINNLGVAYTYNEPVVFFEYMLDTARLVHKKGMKNVMVTNGFINRGPLTELIPYMDAFNVDLKAFTNAFYKGQTKSKLEPVLQTIKTIFSYNKHIELTFLVITSLNDNTGDFKDMVKWISGELSPKVPLHISRYFPDYKLNKPATSQHTLEAFYDIAREQLHHVFLGNIMVPGKSDTYCPECHELLIDREIYQIQSIGIDQSGGCTNCQANVIKHFSNEEDQKTSSSREVLSDR